MASRRSLRRAKSTSLLRPVRARGIVLELLEGRELPASFVPGNLVVYQVGDGVAPLVDTGNVVLLKEFDPISANQTNPVQSISMPTTIVGANRQLIASGTPALDNLGEGLITRSADGRYLIVTGYARNLGGVGPLVGTTSTAVPRTVGRIDVSGNVDTRTALTNFGSTGTIRSATSTIGDRIWVAASLGGLGTTTLGSSTTTSVLGDTNLRQVSIFDGQLYLSGAGPARVGPVGTGLPTSGSSFSNLNGLPSGMTSPYGYFFADLHAATPGYDTLYVADELGGIRKFGLNAGVWQQVGTPFGGLTESYRSLTGVVSGGVVSLYTIDVNGGSNQLVRLVDTAGFNSPMSITETILATAPAGTRFRGVALAPENPTSVYVNSDWGPGSGINVGDYIVDADPITPGNQGAYFGSTAFATIAAATSAVASNGVIWVNRGVTSPMTPVPGLYNEAVVLPGGVTLRLLGDIEIASLASNSSTTSVDLTYLALDTRLTVGRDNTSTSFAGSILGANIAGRILKVGSGTLILSGTNTFGGGLRINNGAISITSDVNLGAAVGSVTIDGSTNASTLIITGTTSLAATRNFSLIDTGIINVQAGQRAVINGQISGGSLVKAGTGILALAGLNTYTGNTAINGGVLQIGDGGTQGNVSLPPALVTVAAGAALEFNRSDSITFANAISGAGSIVQRGTGTTLITGNNSYGGTTTVANGVLRIGSATAIPVATPLIMGTANSSEAGTFDLNGFSTVVGGIDTATGNTAGLLNLITNLSATPVVLTTRTNVLRSYAGAIASTGLALRKEGTGTQVLSGGTANTYGGDTVIAEGILRLGADNSLPLTTLLILGNGATTGIFDLAGFNQTVNTLSSTASAANQIYNSFNAANSVSTLTVQGPGTGIFRGTIADRPAAGPQRVALTVTGGTLSLTGVNSYSGPTNITNGTLFVDGQAVNSLFTVSGGLLGGTGSVGSVTTLPGGTLSPGNDTVNPALLSVNGDLNLGGIFRVDFTQALLSDRLEVTGDVQVGGTLVVNYLSGPGTFNPPPSFQFRIIDNLQPINVKNTGNFIARPEGSFLFVDGVQLRIFYNGGDGNSVTIVNSPPPTIVYTNPAWAALPNGAAIIDADPITPGNQPATIGDNAYASITDALATVLPSGVVMVNSGLYNESVHLTGNRSLHLLGIRLPPGNINTASTVVIGSLSGEAGTSIVTDIAGLPNTLNVGGDNSSTTFAGSISGVGRLSKTGTGTFTLTGISTYTGGTIVDGGVLSFSTSDNLGLDTSPITVASGVLQATGTTTLVGTRSVTIGPPDASGVGTIEVTNGNILTIAGTISNHGIGIDRLVKTGPGTLVLQGFNTYSGTTTVEEGTLTLISDANLGTVPAAFLPASLILASGTTLQTAASFTLHSNRGVVLGPTTGSGSVTIDTSLGSTLTYGGVLANRGAGTGNLVLLSSAGGTGTFLYTGAATYTGSTTIHSGTFQLGNGGASGSIQPTSQITNNGRLVFQRSSDFVFPNTILGSGSLVQQGSNTVTLTAANSFSGGSTVASGTLNNTGSLTSSVQVDASGKLQGTGTSGAVLVAIDGTLAPGSTVVGTYGVNGNFNLAGGLDIRFADASGSGHDQVAAQGSITLTGQLNLSFVGAGTFNPAPGQSFTLIKNNGLLPVNGTFAGLPNASQITLAGQPMLLLYNGGTNNRDVVLIGIQPPSTVYVDDAWAALAPGTIINDADPQAAGDQQAILSYNAFGTITEALAAVIPGGQVLVNGGIYAEIPEITEARSLRLLGTSALTASNVTVQGLLGDGTVDTGNLVNTLFVGSTTDTTFDGAIIGSGNLIKTNPSTFTLTGVSTYSGTTSVQNGELVVNGSVLSPITLDGGNLSGSGSSGSVTVNNGVFSPGNPGAGSGVYTIAGNFSLFAGKASFAVSELDHSSVRVSGVVYFDNPAFFEILYVDNPTSFNPTPGQVLTLIHNHGTFPTIGLESLDGLPVIVDGQPMTFFSNGGDGNDTLLIATPPLTQAFVDDNWSFLNPGTVIADADPVTAGNQPAVIGYNAFSSISAALLAVGPDGTVYVNEGNYSDAVVLAAGQTLILLGTDAATAGSIAVATLSGNGVVDTSSAGNLANTLVVGDNLSSSTFSGRITGLGGLFQLGTGTLILDGPNDYTGPTVLEGTLQFNNGATFGTGPITTNGNLVFNRSDVLTFAASISGIGGVTLTGGGSLTLTGIHSYEGLTLVQDGSLFVDGTLTGPITVASGATLGGTGSSGSVTVNGGFFSPARAGTVGTYTVNGNFILNANSLFTVDFTATNNDLLIVTGITVLNGNPHVSFDGVFTATGGDIFTFIDNTGPGLVAGTFNGLNNGASLTLNGQPFRISYTGGTGNDVILLCVETPVVTYASPTWALLADGTVIPDADPILAGNQIGIIGYNAFGTINAAIAAAASGGSVLVNAGSYAENVAVNKPLQVTGNVVQPAIAQINPVSGTAILVTSSDVILTNLRASSGTTGLSASGLNNLTLDHITLTGQSGSGLSLSNIPTVTIRDLTVLGNGQGGSLSNIQLLDYTGSTGAIDDIFTVNGTLQHTRSLFPIPEINQPLTLTNIATLNLMGLDGSDTFNVTPPAPGRTINIQAGNPTTQPGDSLNVNLSGTTGANLTATASGTSFNGNWTFGNRGPVNFTGIETFAGLTLQFSAAPTSVRSAANFNVTVQVRSNGTLLSSYTGPITLEIATGPTGGTLSGPLTVNAVGGVATFTGLSLDRAGSYTLRAGGLPGVLGTSGPVQVTANQLAFSTVPSSVVASRTAASGFQVQVEARDMTGALATNFNGPVTIARVSGPGGLGGTTTVNAINGIATFNGLFLPRAGNHTLQVTSSTLTGIDIPTVTITSTASQIVFRRVGTVRGGRPFNVRVILRDAAGQLATNFQGNVTLSASNPAVFAPITQQAVNGVVHFIVTALVGGRFSMTAQTTETAPVGNNPLGLPPEFITGFLAAFNVTSPATPRPV